SRAWRLPESVPDHWAPDGFHQTNPPPQTPSDPSARPDPGSWRPPTSARPNPHWLHRSAPHPRRRQTHLDHHTATRHDDAAPPATWPGGYDPVRRRPASDCRTGFHPPVPAAPPAEAGYPPRLLSPRCRVRVHWCG